MAKLKLTNAIAEDLKTAASDSFIDSLKMIEIEDIQPNEDNFYEMSDIEELAEDIERQGLMSVLIVETAENGQYRLISGHRRLTAIKRLVRKEGDIAVTYLFAEGFGFHHIFFFQKGRNYDYWRKNQSRKRSKRSDY